MSEAAAAPATPASAAAPATLGSLMTAPEGAELTTAGAESGDDGGDVTSMSRAEARKILFAAVDEAQGGTDDGAEKPKPAEKKPAEPEPKTEPEKPGDEVELSKKWAKVRAQEDRLVERQKKHHAEAEAFKAEREKFAAQRSELESMVNDPVAFLSKAGWDKDRIVSWIQGDGKVDPEILVKQLSERHQREMEELRAERARERAELENDQRSRKVDALRTQLDTAVAEMVAEPDFELLQKFTAKKGVQGVQTRVRDIIARVWNEKKQAVDPRDVLVYLERELAEVQLTGVPGQVPAVKPANPAAVEPRPITNQATSQRTVVPQSEDDDIESLRERSRRILRGEEE